MSKRMLDSSLLAFTVIFVFFVVLANEDPTARTALFGDMLPKTTWHAKAVYKALYDIGVGGLVSLVFYLLLVRLPDNAKRRRMRRSLERQYKVFKQDCLFVILGVVDRFIDPEKVDELLDQKAFRAYFTEKPIPIAGSMGRLSQLSRRKGATEHSQRRRHFARGDRLRAERDGHPDGRGIRVLQALLRC